MTKVEIYKLLTDLDDALFNKSVEIDNLYGMHSVQASRDTGVWAIVNYLKHAIVDNNDLDMMHLQCIIDEWK